MERTTLVQHIRQQEKANPGATGEFSSLMKEIMVAAMIISLQVNSAGIGEDIFGLTGKINVHGEEVKKLDEFSDITFTKIIGQSGTVCAITSEEKEEPYIIPSEDNPGKYLFMTSATTRSSYLTFCSSRIKATRFINSDASLGFSELGIVNSITLQRECRGSIKRFL